MPPATIARVEIARDGDDAQCPPQHEEVEPRAGSTRRRSRAARRSDGEDEVGAVLGQEVEPRLGRVLRAAPGTGPSRPPLRLLEVVARVAGALRGLHEAGEARLLVALEQVDAGRRAAQSTTTRRAREPAPSTASCATACRRRTASRRAPPCRRARCRGPAGRRRARPVSSAEPDARAASCSTRRRAWPLGEEAGEGERRTGACRTRTAGSVKKPRLIQRVEPRAALPTTRTSAIDPSGADEDRRASSAGRGRVDERDDQRARPPRRTT